MRAKSVKCNGSPGSSEGNPMNPTYLDLCRAFHRLLERAGHVDLEERDLACDGPWPGPKMCCFCAPRPKNRVMSRTGTLVVSLSVFRARDTIRRERVLRWLRHCPESLPFGFVQRNLSK
jgi:hypothetical protein